MGKSSIYKAFRPGAAGRERAEEIRRFILDSLTTDEYRDVTGSAIAKFAVTRQAINKQLNQLEERDLIEGRGRTKARAYRLKKQTWTERTKVAGLQEHVVWDRFANPVLKDLPHNVNRICHFGFTEMLNNVIDHSESENVVVAIERSADAVELTVSDFGVGVFRKIQQTLGLPSEQEALFELTKGKLTTASSMHSGEGIFYTSRMFDRFSLLSGGLFLTHEREGDDWLVGSESSDRDGTMVTMAISPRSTHTMDEVYETYSEPKADFAFNKTNVVLKLLDTGDKSLVSRSQAKRVLARLPRFKEVMLDFSGIEMITPTFADEIFRVFARQHPDVHLHAVRTNEEIRRVIDRVVASISDRDIEAE